VQAGSARCNADSRFRSGCPPAGKEKRGRSITTTPGAKKNQVRDRAKKKIDHDDTKTNEKQETKASPRQSTAQGKSRREEPSYGVKIAKKNSWVLRAKARPRSFTEEGIRRVLPGFNLGQKKEQPKRRKALLWKSEKETGKSQTLGHDLKEKEKAARDLARTSNYQLTSACRKKKPRRDLKGRARQHLVGE